VGLNDRLRFELPEGARESHSTSGSRRARVTPQDAPTPCPGRTRSWSAGFHLAAKHPVCLIHQ